MNETKKSVLAIVSEELYNELAKIFKSFNFTTFFSSDVQSFLNLIHNVKPSIALIEDIFLQNSTLIDYLKSNIKTDTENYGTFYVTIVSKEKLSDISLLNSNYDSILQYFDDYVTKPIYILDLQSKVKIWERVINLQQEIKLGIEKLKLANKQILEANEKMKKDLFAVAKIQTSLLPTNLPALKSVDIAWIYKPRNELAGDGLNVFRLDEHKLAFYVLDVSGTGTSAALLSVSLSRVLSPYPIHSTLLKELTEEPPGYKLKSPSQVLSELNKNFPLDLETNEYFTIFYGIIDIRNGDLNYSTAGFPLPIVIKNSGEIISLQGSGYPVGFFEDAHFDEYYYKINYGDVILLFSDGLLDVKSESNKYFGLENLKKCVSSIGRSYNNLKDLIERILKEAEKWVSNGTLPDDISILAIKYNGYLDVPKSFQKS